MLGTVTISMLVALGLIVGLVGALEVGFIVGARLKREPDISNEQQILTIEAALLGLLALLLGFSFAGAASRFMERQDQIMLEANAIGTVYLRADLLDEPQASELRRLLEEYVRHLLATWKPMVRGDAPDAEKKTLALQAQMWKVSVAGVRGRPDARAILDPLNAVYDMHGTRVAATEKHLPAVILTLLLVCSLLGMGVIGYGCGVCGRRNLLIAAALSMLVGAALWTTIDLDHPRAGLMQLSDKPLQNLRLGEK
jgi:hypothetical protein